MKTIRPGKATLGTLLTTIALLVAYQPFEISAEDNTATNFSDGLTHNVTGDFVVGNSGTNNSLLISNGTTLSDTVNGIIGNGVGANFNFATVTDPNSFWLNGGDLYVGNYGNHNTLIISNGAQVANSTGYIDYQDGYAGNSTVLVTGTGSDWTNRTYLYVGFNGPNSQVIVSNGGRLDSPGGISLGYGGGGVNDSILVSGSGSLLNVAGGPFWFQGLGGQSLTIANGGVMQSAITYYDSPNNTSMVTGVGSVWSNTGPTYMGYVGGDTLIISNGGYAYSGGGYVGMSSNASNNTVIVTGAGSVWNPVGFQLGYVSQGNQLIIADGGTVLGSGNIGAYANGNNNTLLVTGAGSLWSNTANFNVGVGGAGNSAAGNQLIVANGGRVEATYADIGLDVGASNNAVTVTGAGSVLNMSQYLVIGNGDQGNQLTIANGGRVNNTDGYLGNGSSNAVATVSGPGSLWNNTGILYLGNYGTHSTLIVSNGGLLSVGGTTYVGYQGGSDNHQMIVTGAGSEWTNVGIIYMGYNARNAQLTISDGGRVDASGGMSLGLGVASMNDAITITGAGSTLVTPGLSINGGGANLLTVANGGLYLNNGSTYWFSANNTGVVTGVGSVWTNTAYQYMGYAGHDTIIVSDGGYLYSPGASLDDGAGTNTVIVSGGTWNPVGVSVGVYSSGDRVIVTNGGTVITAAGLGIGNNTSAANFNSVTVTGSGSTWSNGSDTTVGYYGHDNQLVIGAGGRLNNAGVTFIGYQAGSSNNSLTVTGPGSQLNEASYVYLGILDGNNRLTISNGGQINDVSGFAGHGSTSSNNVAVVTDPGSQWNNSGNFYVGNYAPNSTLIISNGGFVADANGYINYQAPSANNSVVVTGAGSQWTNSSLLYIGNGGPGGSLTVTGGGRVDALQWNLGYGIAGSNDTLVVTGSGSLVNSTAPNNPGTYGIVAGGGGSNQLTIANGGRVQNSSGVLFGYGGNGGNTALVTGAGSQWTNAGIMYIGYTGGNQLIIANGGRVDSAGFGVGNTVAGSGNIVVVTDPGSIWNPGGGQMGYQSANNQLIITNGGQALMPGGINVGTLTTATNNLVQITGPGSILQSASTVTVGSNGVYTFGGGRIDVTDGGTLETTALVGGLNGSGIISNRQGVYQFTTATPGITPNTAGAISLFDGTISYRGVTGADINNAQVANIAFLGNNTFQLKDSSSTTVPSYTFDSVAHTGNPANYQRLALVGNSTWQGTTLNIASGGAMLISNATATVSASLFDAGDVHVVNSTASFGGPVTISGTFRSDPSTITFLADVTLTNGGALIGGPGDVFIFERSFLLSDTSIPLSDLSQSTLEFGGGNGHTNSVVGHDYGATGSGYAPWNYEYGTLALDLPSDQLYFTSNGVGTAALYVDTVDLLGNTNYVANLHSAYNIYYLGFDPQNAYLHNLTYALDGGGFLTPAIPEPSTMMLLALAGLFLRRRRP